MKNLVIKNKLKIAAVTLAAVMLFAGCNIASASETTEGSEESESATEITDESYELAELSEVFTDSDYEVGYTEEDSTEITLDGESVTISEAGTYILTGTIEDGQIIIDADDEDTVRLVLNGVDITCETSAAIYVKNAEKVIITLASGTTNTLSTTGEFEADGDTNVDAVIFSKEDLTLNGEGTLVISSTGNGITSKDNLVITSGTYEIDAGKHGLEGKDSVAISSGTFTITCVKDGIHSDNEDDEELGNILIEGGTFTITAQDDGISGSGDVVIDGGTIDVTTSYEGIEGHTLTINDGDISIYATDDGLNAAGPSGGDTMMADDTAWIIINGGTIDIEAYGDGIDSNGDLTINGGYITVSGPESAADGSIDYEGEGTITGGTLIAAGSSGMAVNMSTATQGSILVSFDEQEEGTEIIVYDESGNVVLSFTPKTSYSCVVVSSPDLTIGSTYTIVAGDSEADVSLDEYVYGQSTGMGMGGFGFGGGGQMPGGDMDGGGMPGGDFDFEDGEMPEMPSGDIGGQMPGGGGPGGQAEESDN